MSFFSQRCVICNEKNTSKFRVCGLCVERLCRLQINGEPYLPMKWPAWVRPLILEAADEYFYPKRNFY